MGLASPTHLIILLVIILLLFGAKRIPELAKGLGQGMQEFKKGVNDPVEEGDESSKNRESVEGRQEDAGEARQEVHQETSEGTSSSSSEESAESSQKTGTTRD